MFSLIAATRGRGLWLCWHDLYQDSHVLENHHYHSICYIILIQSMFALFLQCVNSNPWYLNDKKTQNAMQTLFVPPLLNLYQQSTTLLPLSLSKNNSIKSSLLESTKRGPEMSSSLMHSDSIHQCSHAFPNIQPRMH